MRERICQFITEYTDTHSYAPTIREICASVGLKSSSSVHSHLTQLEIEGRIETMRKELREYMIRLSMKGGVE